MWIDAPYIDASIPFEIIAIDEMTNFYHFPSLPQLLALLLPEGYLVISSTLAYSIYDSKEEGTRKMIESSKKNDQRIK